ncbi:NAD(P)-binding protein [Exidia glandulosa HHB12029]|uniref:NAD(P)-binding protein n=1 Tax=Exidia glandulosa HHB12029 TaxID=1314781 RepID=A0A165FYW4_EXIGL|nr:NAD(P)-binding protein [Exidia glandulosa HHB12029]
MLTFAPIASFLLPALGAVAQQGLLISPGSVMLEDEPWTSLVVAAAAAGSAQPVPTAQGLTFANVAATVAGTTQPTAPLVDSPAASIPTATLPAAPPLIQTVSPAVADPVAGASTSIPDTVLSTIFGATSTIAVMPNVASVISTSTVASVPSTSTLASVQTAIATSAAPLLPTTSTIAAPTTTNVLQPTPSSSAPVSIQSQSTVTTTSTSPPPAPPKTTTTHVTTSTSSVSQSHQIWPGRTKTRTTTSSASPTTTAVSDVSIDATNQKHVRNILIAIGVIAGILILVFLCRKFLLRKCCGAGSDRNTLADEEDFWIDPNARHNTYCANSQMGLDAAVEKHREVLQAATLAASSPALVYQPPGREMYAAPSPSPMAAQPQQWTPRMPSKLQQEDNFTTIPRVRFEQLTSGGTPRPSIAQAGAVPSRLTPHLAGSPIVEENLWTPRVLQAGPAPAPAQTPASVQSPRPDQQYSVGVGELWPGPRYGDIGDFRRIVYLGASGPFGETMTEELLNAGWHVVILARDPSKIPARSNTTIVQYTPTDHSSLVAAMRGAEVVLCSTGGTSADPLGFQKPLIDAAIEAGVKRYIPTEYAGDLQHPRSAANAIHQGRRAVLAYLKEKAEKGEIQWTMFHTGGFIEMGLRTGFLKIDVKGRKAVIRDGGNDGVVHVTYRTTARATVRALSTEHFAATANRAVRTGDATLTQSQLLQLVEKAAGTKFEVANETAAESLQRGLGNSKLMAGEADFAAVRDIILSDFYVKDNYCQWSLTDNEWLGVETQNLEEVINKVVKEILA